jgi:hypothetical protein
MQQRHRRVEAPLRRGCAERGTAAPALAFPLLCRPLRTRIDAATEEQDSRWISSEVVDHLGDKLRPQAASLAAQVDSTSCVRQVAYDKASVMSAAST